MHAHMLHTKAECPEHPVALEVQLLKVFERLSTTASGNAPKPSSRCSVTLFTSTNVVRPPWASWTSNRPAPPGIAASGLT